MAGGETCSLASATRHRRATPIHWRRCPKIPCRVLRRRRDIACVLVNPLQALHPNAAAPAYSSLVDSMRHAEFDRAAYTGWLRKLRAVCDERGIALIFDEVFVGFRLARGGAREYFGVQPDLITYGKTLGGGLPVGVLCGRGDLMKRYRPDRPIDICFARERSTRIPMSWAPCASSCTSSTRLTCGRCIVIWIGSGTPAPNNSTTVWRIFRSGSPISSIWTVCYTRPSRYNWMLQFYLRAEGLALSWVGTGRLIFSLNYTDGDFDAVEDRFLAGCRAMERDGWWGTDDRGSNRSIRRRILREMLTHRRFGTAGRLARSL